MADFQKGLIAAYVVEAFSVNAEVEAMKAENANRERHGLAQAYGEAAFMAACRNLGGIATAIREVARG